MKNSEYTCTYKVPLKEKELDNIENKGELIYKSIMLMTSEKFYQTIDLLNKLNS